MSRAISYCNARRRMAGLSLIEMMVALVMALIVAAGIITIFSSTSSSNKVQAQMAALQEEGRFAIHSLRTDLSNANGAYCSNSGGNAGGTGSGLYLDALRSPIVYANSLGTIDDNTVTVPAPTQAFVLPSYLFMRGYDCSTTGCLPNALAPLAPGVPDAGTAVGKRVVGSDVLTVRYLKPDSGWAIMPAGSAIGTTMSVTGGVATITLRQLAGEPPISDFTGSLALVADCSTAGIYAVTNSSGTLTATGANYASPPDLSLGKPTGPRVFDFGHDFQTVTYFLRVVDTDDGHTTGELVRRVNGVDQPLVRGVERLDFLYGIIDANGVTRFLTANEVDTGVDAGGSSIACPPQMPPLSGVTNDAANGCLWRAVQTIEVHVLMDGQRPLYTLTPQEMKYIYTLDGNTLAAPSAHAVKPQADQGFPEQLIRREFTSLVALRNYNP